MPDQDENKVTSSDISVEPTHNPKVDQDPEVLNEEKRLRIRLLRLKYYTELAKTAGILLQTFKAEATSLVSGVGTLVMGYYQLKKWVINQKTAIRAIDNKEMSVPSYKHGNGTLEYKHKFMEMKKGGEEIKNPYQNLSVATTMPDPNENHFYADPTFYLWITLAGVFTLSSVRAWWKRRNSKKQGDNNVAI